MDKTIDFTRGRPLPLIMSFSIPIFIGYLFQQVYSLVDRVIVGQFVGPDAFFVVPLKMGVNGAAIATVLAQCIAAVCCIFYAFRKIPVIRTAAKFISPDKEILAETFRIGLPTGFQFAVVYLSGVVLQGIVNGFGTSVIGAFAATTQVEILVQQIYATLGTTLATYTAQNIGAGKPERIRQGCHTVMLVCAAVSALWLVLAWLGGNLIMGVFVDDNAMTGIAAMGIRITAVFFMAFGVTTVLRRLLAGAGDSLFTLTSGVMEIIARILFGFALTAVPALGMWEIWLTTGFTWLVTAVSALWRYHRSNITVCKTKQENKE